MEKSESIKELATALCKAQGELGHAKKDSVNPHFRSKYSDISEVLDTIKPVFNKHGLSFLQMPSMEGNLLTLNTMLLHASGEWISEIAMTPIAKQDPHGVLAGITYLRRGALTAFAGLSQEDDDGNTASSKPDHDYSPAQARKPQPSPSRPMAPVVSKGDDTPPPMSDNEVTSIAFNIDDDTPAWMTSSPAQARNEEGKVYHYKPPFNQKDRAKELGCRWNAELKTWDSKTQIPEFDAYIK